ncbi:MAG: ABC transporter permease [Acidobacteriia bacterium]|nr:ABC transporter permease [Terriglobia bacterium]
MRRFARHAARILIILLLGGFLGATLVRLAPGFGTDEEELDSRLNQQSIQALRQSHTNDGSLGQFYLHYLTRLLHGDLGTSKTLQQPVTRLLAERFPETLKSVGMGLALGWSLGLALAIVAVMSRSWFIDLFTSLAAGALLCVPAAVLALLFVIAQAPGRLVLGLVVFPKIFRYARNLLARSASLPHVLTARAKGLGGFRVLLWHILPVAAPQLLALAGVSVSLAFAASIPVEVLCDLPGIGQLAWKAAMGRDLQLLVSLTMVVTAVTLVANSASDLVGRSLREGAA